MNGDDLPKVTAFVALGANLGDSQASVLRGFEALQACSADPIICSSLWQSLPVDCPPGSPLFVNAVAAFAPRQGETPESLLRKLLALERQFGRRPKLVLNEPRPLDLDLIVFGEEVRASKELILPHPRAHQRAFVLLPLAEIAPHLILPGQTRTVRELAAALPEQTRYGVRRLTAS